MATSFYNLPLVAGTDKIMHILFTFLDGKDCMYLADLRVKKVKM